MLRWFNGKMEIDKLYQIFLNHSLEFFLSVIFKNHIDTLYLYESIVSYSKLLYFGRIKKNKSTKKGINAPI
jgi:hypothetical protein